MQSNKFDIELDRPSKVYYTGEVVTGTLTLKNSTNEKCRSLLVSMVGKGKVHWHTGSGDSRSDFDGKKDFLWHERTLVGNFYRTAILDEGGENVEFGGAVGDGTMHIPCRPNEGTNGSGPMRLIVRVCDYDWGKRDDNIGEIVIDAKELALKGDAVTINLTRNGKPEKGTVTLAANFIPTSAILGESASASQSAETLVIKVLKANSLRKADMFGQNDVYVQVWRAPDSLQSPPPVGKKLPLPDQKILLPQGNTTFKFAFPTRADSPGSAVLHCGDHAYLAYYIRAEIDRKGWKNPSLKLPVVILPSRPVPMRQLLCPFFKEIGPAPIHKMKVCCFSCGEAGTITMKFALNRSAFAPGENIDLTGSEVVNDSTLDINVRVVLRQNIQLSTTGKFDTRTSGSQRFYIVEQGIAPQSSLRLDTLKASMPAVSPSFFGAKGLSTARREPLTFTYELSLQAKASSGHKVKIDTPILVSALPPKPEAVKEASTNIPVQTTNPFELAIYAVTDDGPCDTVVMHTGIEDGGTVVASEAGPTNIWEHQDDSGNAGAQYTYQPQVLMFSDNTNTNTGASPFSSAPEMTNEVDHGTAYSSLLASMDAEYDSRAAVDKWIKEYPSAASSLTPGEFAGVLKKVLLSMEQASVARELASGMASGSLLTDHIVASMQACPFTKMEIVRVLAPYVSDPERKEVVLSNMYSYERNEASMLFP